MGANLPESRSEELSFAESLLKAEEAVSKTVEDNPKKVAQSIDEKRADDLNVSFLSDAQGEHVAKIDLDAGIGSGNKIQIPKFNTGKSIAGGVPVIQPGEGSVISTINSNSNSNGNGNYTIGKGSSTGKISID